MTKQVSDSSRKLVADEDPRKERPLDLAQAQIRQRKIGFAKVNAELDGALEGSPTWENERKKQLLRIRLQPSFLNCWRI
ncbi:hypothetical protein [Arcanobacterium hippocoleae]|uniref:hypothetical protein n=1 Tax=Arcanobacterium hippocoleae TaxID=149017 RepID=UPI003342604F